MATKRLTAQETAARHGVIVALKLAGWTVMEIAAQVEMTPRGVEMAYAKWRDADKLDLATMAGKNPLDFIHEHLAGFRVIRRTLWDCSLVATNDSAKVGALKACAEMREKEINLLQQVGMLPKELGRFAIDIDVHVTTAKVVELIAALPITEEQKADFADSMVAALNPGKRLEERALELAQQPGE